MIVQIFKRISDIKNFPKKILNKKYYFKIISSTLQFNCLKKYSQISFLKNKRYLKKYEKCDRKLNKWENFVQQNKINFSEFFYTKSLSSTKNKAIPSQKFFRKRIEISSKDRKFYSIFLEIKDTIGFQSIKKLLTKSIFFCSSLRSSNHNQLCKKIGINIGSKQNGFLIYNRGAEFNKNPNHLFLKKI